MCLAAIAIGQSARFPWVLASNRDEFHDRPTAPLAWWWPEGDRSAVLGGRDLAAGGSWLALREDGRLALITNVREPGRFDPAAPSRGKLVLDGLRAGPADTAWLRSVSDAPCNGFNLLLADLGTDQAVWASNRPGQQRMLGAGVFGLSNASLDTPWPKVSHLKTALGACVRSGQSAAQLAEGCFATLADRNPAPDHLLPSTGIPQQRERQLSSPFIHIPPSGTPPTGAYGTRCSTVVVVESVAGHRPQAGDIRRPAPEGDKQSGPAIFAGDRWVHIFERRFDAAGAYAGQVAYRFMLGLQAQSAG